MALVVGACAVTSISKAQSAPIPTRLDWVTTVCGDDESFASRVLKRTRAVRFVGSGARFTVRLSIETRGSALEARVRIEGPGGPDTVRQIASPNCEDALDAVALVVAISLEARAAELKKATPITRPQRPRSPPPRKLPEALPSPPAAPAEQPLAPASSPPEPQTPAPAAPAPAAPEAPPPAPAPAPPLLLTVPGAEASPAPLERAGREAPLAPRVRADDGDGWAFGTGVSALFSLGVAPRVLIGAAFWLRSSWEREGVWAPTASLGVAHQRLDGLRQPGGEADFALTVANLELCPVRIGAGPLRVRPCATGSAGQLSASGHQTFSAAAWTRPWGALGASLQSSVLLGPLELGATLGVARPLVRDSFRFGLPCVDSGCSGSFHRVEPLIWTGAVDVGLRF
jgi:hypothetical protein